MHKNLQVNVSEVALIDVPAIYARVSMLPVSASAQALSFAAGSSKILRFAKSERMLHWAIAGPFLVSFATGAILALFYNVDPSRPWRHIFSMVHRISGIALAICPMLALLCGRHDIRIHLYNIRQAWTWIYDDFKWLSLMGLAAISSRFVLPEQGKFNAAEKLNFMVLMSTYPLYVVTGFLMWLIPLAVLSWIMHCLMAMMATPLVLGHLYMALVNGGTRPGLEGMISGHVDREWAKHHYRRWYRHHHEASEEQLSSKEQDKDTILPIAVHSIVRQPIENIFSADGQFLIPLPLDTDLTANLARNLCLPPQAIGSAEESNRFLIPAPDAARKDSKTLVAVTIPANWIEFPSIRQTCEVWIRGLMVKKYGFTQTRLRSYEVFLPRLDIYDGSGLVERGSCGARGNTPARFLALQEKLNRTDGILEPLYGSRHENSPAASVNGWYCQDVRFVRRMQQRDRLHELPKYQITAGLVREDACWHLPQIP